MITNCRLITPFAEIERGEVLIEGGKIPGLGPAGTCRDYDACLDAGGRIVAPGFIELHIQGAGGCDVLDGSLEALKAISRSCARFGVTGFLATTVFRPEGNNRHLEIAAECSTNEQEGAELLGIHLEGPFISPEKRGMIKKDCINRPDRKVLETILSLTGGCLRMMTVAPELGESGAIIRALTERGIVASFGHSMADYEQTKEGFAAGINHVTHLFNAMLPIHHRSPGPLPAIFETDSVTAQLIADGVHVHTSVLQLAARILGPERLVLITDGMQAMGLPDGSYVYNGLEYVSKNGTARYLDGTLIGTSLGLSQCLGRFVSLAGLSISRAIRAASLNPARVLGIDDSKGSIERGKDADLVLLNRDLTVWKTIRQGRFIYQASGESNVQTRMYPRKE